MWRFFCRFDERQISKKDINFYFVDRFSAPEKSVLDF